MNKKKLIKITSNPRHISGIHNYCDRWCERCTNTLRCSVYALERADSSNNQDHDLENNAFWDRLYKMHDLTMELLREDARENNIDLNIMPNTKESENDKQCDEQADKHPLVTSATVYMYKIKEWFTSNEEFFDQYFEQFDLRYQMKLPGDDIENHWQQVKDALEIILWYFMFIGVKLRRAVHQPPFTAEFDDEDIDVTPFESDGPVKIALIGIDRSLAAWTVLLKFIPEQEQEILDFLVQLERLRRQVEQTFPNARAFVRPGFDE